MMFCTDTQGISDEQILSCRARQTARTNVFPACRRDLRRNPMKAHSSNGGGLGVGSTGSGSSGSAIERGFGTWPAPSASSRSMSSTRSSASARACSTRDAVGSALGDWVDMLPSLKTAHATNESGPLRVGTCRITAAATPTAPEPESQETSEADAIEPGARRIAG